MPAAAIVEIPMVDSLPNGAVAEAGTDYCPSTPAAPAVPGLKALATKLERSFHVPRHLRLWAASLRAAEERVCSAWFPNQKLPYYRDADMVVPAQWLDGSGNSPSKDLAKESFSEGTADQGIASRQLKVIAFASSAGLFCYYTRSVLSIVIPQIAAELHLKDPTTALSCFFYGYVVTNAMSSVVLQHYHPKRLVLFSVFFSSLCTVLLPLAIRTAGYPGLVACRACAGLTQGFLFPSLYGLLGSELAADPAGKTRALAILGGVVQLGIALNFLGSPMLLDAGGWQLAVGVAGCLGFPWCLLWITSSVYRLSPENPKADGHVNAGAAAVPYREILAAKPFRAVVCGHFAHNWAGTAVMTWLPTYLRQELHVQGKSLGVACLPYVAMALASPLAGALAGLLLRRRWDLWLVRRTMSVGGLLCPAAGLLIFPHIQEDWWPLPIVCVVFVMAFTTWASSSVLASPLDLAGPRFAGALFSITNGICAVPCFLGVEVVGAVRDMYGWSTAWGLCSALYIVAFVLYLQMGSARRMFD